MTIFDQSIIKWVSITDRYTKMYLDKRLAHLGLNSSQYIYVVGACDRPGIPQTDFLTLFYVNPSNVTRAVTGLEASGYLERRPDEKDKRVWRIYPTEKARQAYGEIRSIYEDWYARALAGLSPEEVQRLAETMEQIGQRMVRLAEEDRNEKA